MLPADQARHVGLLVARVALHDRLRLGEHGFGEPIGDRILDQNSERTKTDLTRVVELLDRQADGKIEIRISKDHERRLAAEFERQRHDVGRRGLGDHTGSRHGTGERQPTDAGCAVSGAPAWAPVP